MTKTAVYLFTSPQPNIHTPQTNLTPLFKTHHTDRERRPQHYDYYIALHFRIELFDS